MTNQEFLEYMNSGNEVIAGSDVHQKMTELSNEAMKITFELNNSYHTPEEIKVLMIITKPHEAIIRAHSTPTTDGTLSARFLSSISLSCNTRTRSAAR